jgi:DNA topoisomerase IB
MTAVIPPAWEDVWICADPDGHIQAVGTDSAGRRQYRYHDLWREQRDRREHDRMLEFGAALPRIRKTVSRHVTGTGLGRERVLAASIRLIDLGFFRPGGEAYSVENATFGLATIRREHVTCAHVRSPAGLHCERLPHLACHRAGRGRPSRLEARGGQPHRA